MAFLLLSELGHCLSGLYPPKKRKWLLTVLIYKFESDQSSCSKHFSDPSDCTINSTYHDPCESHLFGYIKQEQGGLYTAPHNLVGLHQTPGDFPQSTWSPGTFFFGKGTAKFTCNCYPQAFKLGLCPTSIINVYGTNPTTQKTE